jgi:hypothetical protein
MHARFSTSVSFIVFNYDRCLEQFLFHALQKLYGLESQEAFAMLTDLRIIHPYGADPPPLKWSELRYVFDIKEDCNGKEAIQA